MDDFTSPNLQLILGVKEASHFDRVLKPTVVIATLNGHCLESKKIQPSCNPRYTTDLIWDTDKNALRRMRCNHTPIKVECFVVNDNGSREKIGYILLSVRSAQIIHHRDTESNIKTTWHNILGIRNDFNNCKPQLLLYLIIKEKNNAFITEENASLESPQSKPEKIHVNPHSRIPSVSLLEKIVHFNEKPPTFKNTSLMNNELHQCEENDWKPINQHTSYRLNVYLNSIRFFDSISNVKIIEFRFYHPHGEMITAVSKTLESNLEQTVQLKNVECKLHFISPSNEIQQLLTMFAPKINICDKTFHESKCIAQISLDINRLFIGKKPECQYITSLVDCHVGKEIGNADITLVLEDYNMSILNRIQEGTSETILDNNLAYKIVNELETWKERQKEMFKDELRKTEETHLRLLNEEWRKRRTCLESKLETSVEQCKLLANNLNQVTQDLRVRKIQSLEKETKLIQANQHLQCKYDGKLHQLQDALQNMQQEFSTKLKSLEEQNTTLLLQIQHLNEENKKLEKIRRDQSQELEACTKFALTQDQTTTLLQQLKNVEEKLDDTQKSKAYFKDQWSKAVKEIHGLKMENQQAMNSQIKNSKNELNNVDLEEKLYADSTALTYDKMALNQLQREIDIMHPKSNATESILNSDRNYPRSDVVSTDSSLNDGKLHILIKERDSLIKNGNFSSQDRIIKNLNAEIRSILINS